MAVFLAAERISVWIYRPVAAALSVEAVAGPTRAPFGREVPAGRPAPPGPVAVRSCRVSRSSPEFSREAPSASAVPAALENTAGGDPPPRRVVLHLPSALSLGKVQGSHARTVLRSHWIGILVSHLFTGDDVSDLPAF